MHARDTGQVLHRDRAAHAAAPRETGGRLDAELRQIARARLPVIDEFGYMPIDEEGSGLLFQVISDSYETRSVIHATNIGFSGWGACSATRTWPPR